MVTAKKHVWHIKLIKLVHKKRSSTDPLNSRERLDCFLLITFNFTLHSQLKMASKNIPPDKLFIFYDADVNSYNNNSNAIPFSIFPRLIAASTFVNSLIMEERRA